MIRRADAPVLDAAALRVARADREVGLAGVDRHDEAGQRLRIVRPVGVHLDDGGRAAAERHPEPVEVGPTEALLRGPMLHAHARIGRREPVREVAGPVGRAVVDDEQHGAAGARRGSPPRSRAGCRPRCRSAGSPRCPSPARRPGPWRASSRPPRPACREDRARPRSSRASRAPSSSWLHRHRAECTGRSAAQDTTRTDSVGRLRRPPESRAEIWIDAPRRRRRPHLERGDVRAVGAPRRRHDLAARPGCLKRRPSASPQAARRRERT